MSLLSGWLEKGRALLRPQPAGTTVIKPAVVKIAIIGNCQGGALSHLLPMLTPRIQVLRAIPIDATADNVHDAHAAVLSEADFIISQSIKDTYPLDWVRRSRLTEAYGDKLIFYTNHFFDGYFPELCYIHDPEGRRHVLPGPMADYHYKTVIHAWKQGLSAAEALALCEDDAFHAANYGHFAEKSLAELARREEGVDIRIHDTVAQTYRDRLLFFTFNHPTTHLLLQTCVQILDRLGLKPETDPSAVNPGEYLEIVSKPVPGPVYREQGLTFANLPAHKGYDLIEEADGFRLGERRLYDLPEVIEAFYRLYDANRERVMAYRINFSGLMG